MARVRARATTTEGRFLASRIQDAKRRGATNAQIARAFGINERTVRKIRSGESSGTRTFGKLVEPTRGARVAQGANPSIVRVDIRLSNGMIRTVNARVPTILDRRGNRVTPTPADLFRIPKLETLIDAEIKRLEQHYGLTGAEIDPDAECERSYCHHPASAHVQVFGTLDECTRCRCPRYRLDREARVVSFRPIALRRKPLRIEITGYA